MWIDICGFEGMYQVSDLGEIRSVPRVVERRRQGNLLVKGKLLTYGTNKDGYYIVQLHKDGKNSSKLVHKVVWENFNGLVPKGLEIGHNDGDNHNNKLDNLYLCTHKENCNHQITRKRQSERMKGNTISKGLICKYRIPIVCLDLDYNLIKEYDFLDQVEEDGFSAGNVSLCCKNTYSTRGNVSKNRIFMTKQNYQKMLEKELES